MRLISWNVNGLRACLGKGFADFFASIDADIFCIQETKMQEGQAEFTPEGYLQYWNSAVKKGYSGTAVFTKIPPLSVSYGIGIEEHDNEGRVITLEFEDFILVNCYTNVGNAGFTNEEREKMTQLLDSGFCDSFRALYPDKTGAYSWWSYMYNARANNAGWRIDYFIVSKRIQERIKDSVIYSEIMGSDHCPVGLELL